MSAPGDGPFAAANAALRLLLELSALGYWSDRTGEGAAGSALAAGVPPAVAVVWGLVGAPAAP